jgi:hypothetical protein
LINPLLLLLLLLLRRPQNLLSPGNGSQVTAKGFICEIYDCCNPCNPTKQEASCVSPLAGPRLEFKPTLESCPTLPPPVDVGGEVRVLMQRPARQPKSVQPLNRLDKILK